MVIKGGGGCCFLLSLSCFTPPSPNIQRQILKECPIRHWYSLSLAEYLFFGAFVTLERLKASTLLFVDVVAFFFPLFTTPPPPSTSIMLLTVPSRSSVQVCTRELRARDFFFLCPT